MVAECGMAGDSMKALARRYWARARSYYSDGSGLVGLRTGASESGSPIVWCRPGVGEGEWIETGSTLTPGDAEKVVF